MNANEQLHTIESILSQAKTNQPGLYRLWFLYGGFLFLSVVFGYLAAFSVGREVFSFLGNIVLPILLAVSFFVIFCKEKRTANKYYLGCLAFWGIPTVALPIFAVIMRVAAVLFAAGAGADILSRLVDVERVTENLFLCLCLLLCAFLLKKRWIVVVALVSLFLLTVLYTTENVFFFSPVPSVTVSGSALLHHLLKVTGYFTAAFLLRKKIKDERSGHSANGS